MFFAVGAYAEESLTITTYYPSPQGSYKTLKTKRLAVGDNYYKLKWQDEGGTIANDADLVVEQKVGINTTTPGAMLSIFGGQLGTNVGDTILMQELDSNTCCEDQSLRFFAQRANIGSDWTTADLVLQRKVDSDNFGFIKWAGGDAGIEFGTGSSTYLKMGWDGNVSVGGGYPSRRLTVYTNPSDSSLDGIHLTNGTRWMRLMPGTVTAGAYNNLVAAGDNALIFSAGIQGTGNLTIAPWAAATSGIKITNTGSMFTTNWTNPSFDSGWSNYASGYQPVQYKKVGDLVFLRGLATSGSNAWGTYRSIFTLPVGYRPAYRLIFAQVANANVLVRLDIVADGRVYWESGGAGSGWISLDGIVFSVD